MNNTKNKNIIKSSFFWGVILVTSMGFDIYGSEEKKSLTDEQIQQVLADKTFRDGLMTVIMNVNNAIREENKKDLTNNEEEPYQ